MRSATLHGAGAIIGAVTEIDGAVLARATEIGGIAPQLGREAAGNFSTDSGKSDSLGTATRSGLTWPLEHAG
ncbi:MAG: hypothetical protein WBA68_00100, partial [Alteraurantiacibacter sp.]